MANAAKTVTPNDLAEQLYGKVGRERGGKLVRSFLRSTFPRDVKNVTWVLDANGIEVKTVRAWHAARKNGKNFDAAAFVKSSRARKRTAKTAPNVTVPSEQETV